MNAIQEAIFGVKNRTDMVTVTDKMYDLAAQKLIDRIGRGNFFNGTIEVCDGETTLEFIATLIIYRLEKELGGDDSITQVVPVWWEAKTTTAQGVTLNDFDWQWLRNLLV